MDKTGGRRYTIDIPQDSRVRRYYGAFNELPYGKTIEDVPEHYRWLFNSPIHTTYSLDGIKAFVHECKVIRGQSRRVDGERLQVDTIFPDCPSIQVVIRYQEIIELPWTETL